MNNVFVETPVERASCGMLFRTYLRKNLYPSHQGDISDILSANILDATEVDCGSDSFEYRVKCKAKKSSTMFDYTTQIENSLLGIVRAYNIPAMVNMDQSVTDYDKSRLMKVCQDLCTYSLYSCYIKMMYNLTCLQSNTSSRLLSVVI